MGTIDESRFAKIYDLHHRQVYAYCRRRTDAERAEDAVADTFLTAWRKIDQVPEDDEALPWLFAVAYRVLGHQWRAASRQRRLREKLAATGRTYVEMPEDYIVVQQESQHILRALSNLRAKDQEILRLTVWEELNHREIAEMFDITTDSVKKRLSRARKSLAREYERIERSLASPAAQKGGAW